MRRSITHLSQTSHPLESGNEYGSYLDEQPRHEFSCAKLTQLPTPPSNSPTAPNYYSRAPTEYTLMNLSHSERLRLSYLPTIFVSILTLTLSHSKKKQSVGTVNYYYIQTGLMT